MGESTQSMRPVRCRSSRWQIITYGQLVVVVATAPLVVSPILTPSIGLPPPAPTEPPETSAPARRQPEADQSIVFSFEPYLSICAYVPALAWFKRADAGITVARGMQQPGSAW